MRWAIRAHRTALDRFSVRPGTYVRCLHSRVQGDLGEVSALEWLVGAGAYVYVPVGHSPDCDLVADLEGRLVRVQVKTSRFFYRGRWYVELATRGGNRSWSGIVRRFSPTRADFLFAHVADGRRWFIPANEIEGGTRIVLGGRSTQDSKSIPVGRSLQASAIRR